MNDDAEPLALLVTAPKIERPPAAHDYWTVDVRPVTVAADGTPRDITAGWNLDPPYNLADLTISAQNDTRHGAEGSGLYAWSTEYNHTGSIDSRRALSMHRTLAGIERHLAKIDAKYGPPATFAAYVRRVGDALKIDRYLIPTSPPTTWYADGEYRDTDAAAAEFHLNDRERQYIKVCAPDYHPEPAL